MKHLLISLCLCGLGFTINTNLYGQANTREINIKQGQTYLNFPVDESNQLRKVRIMHDGKVLDEFTLRLADTKPDFWTFFDVAPYQGKAITLEMEETDTQAEDIAPQGGLSKVYADAHFPGQDSVYNETLRPQVHFSSQRGWHNDPNGLIYYEDEYHLFYQHNPFGWSWGNMHWGHAVSKDLLHWKELPDALYTPNHDDMAFSGSAVVDPQNTADFRKDGIDPLIAVYTSTGRGECIALSYDNGRTFEDYEGNPVVKHRGRDPKVFWYEPGNHWVMVLYDESKMKELSDGEEAMIRQHVIYTSPDLKDWTYQSNISGLFECPELFEMQVEGESGTTKWVMYGADGKYLVGDFDGKKFIMEQNAKNYDYGRAFYASQLYNNIPESDGRHIQIGWGRGIDLEGMPFNQCMTFPTQLSLKSTFDGYRLCPRPVKEITSLHQDEKVMENIILKGDTSFLAPVKGDLLHIIAEFECGDSRDFGMNINGYELVYNNLFREFKGENYPAFEGETLKVEVIVDKAIIEVFVNDGELYFVDPLNSVEAKKGIKVFANGGGDEKTILKKLEMYQLDSVWKENM
ncbi:MAG: glycoside hydrolase family 32 protein [Cyclobacteriaceae bacterium]